MAVAVALVGLPQRWFELFVSGGEVRSKGKTVAKKTPLRRALQPWMQAKHLLNYTHAHKVRKKIWQAPVHLFRAFS